jgi:hypothetical protein
MEDKKCKSPLLLPHGRLQKGKICAAILLPMLSRIANPGLFMGIVAPAGYGKNWNCEGSLHLVSCKICLRLLKQPSPGMSLGILHSVGE